MAFLKPGMHINADGKPQQLVCRLPNLRLVPPDGMELDEHDFVIARMIRDKDLVPAEPPATAKT